MTCELPSSARAYIEAQIVAKRYPTATGLAHVDGPRAQALAVIDQFTLDHPALAAEWEAREELASFNSERHRLARTTQLRALHLSALRARAAAAQTAANTHTIPRADPAPAQAAEAHRATLARAAADLRHPELHAVRTRLAAAAKAAERAHRAYVRAQDAERTARDRADRLHAQAQTATAALAQAEQAQIDDLTALDMLAVYCRDAAAALPDPPCMPRMLPPSRRRAPEQQPRRTDAQLQATALRHAASIRARFQYDPAAGTLCRLRTGKAPRPLALTMPSGTPAHVTVARGVVAPVPLVLGVLLGAPGRWITTRTPGDWRALHLVDGTPAALLPALTAAEALA